MSSMLGGDIMSSLVQHMADIIIHIGSAQEDILIQKGRLAEA